MKRGHTVLAAVIIFVAVIFVFSYLSAQKPAEQTIKIGAILPLSGEGTIDQGQASRDAIVLAVEKINKNGGILNRTLEVFFEDSQCDAKIGVTAIRKLLEINSVDFVIGDICDSVTASIIPIAENGKKILITPGSTSPDISHAGDYIFRFWFSENDLGGMVADEAYSLGYRRMAIIYIDNAWGEAQKNAVSLKFTGLGGEVVGAERIGANADFRTVLLKLEDKKPDSYYIGVHPYGLASLMKQMRELNISKQVFSHGGLVGSTEVLGLGEGGILEGIMAPFVYNASQSFVHDFAARFGKEPGITADSSYDIVVSVAKIIENKGRIDSEAIKSGLYELKDYSGASGNITVDENGDTHRLLSMMVVRGGKLVPL